MSDIQSQQSESSNQSSTQTQASPNPLANEINASLDLAALAAEQMSKASGLANPEQAAAVITQLLSRVEALEAIIPTLKTTYDALMEAYDGIIATKAGSEIEAKIASFITYGEQVLGFRHTNPVPVAVVK